MNLNPIGGYESHKVVHAADFDRERHASHRRAREEHKLESRQSQPDAGFVSRFLARWRQRARIEFEPVVRTAQQILTESACVLVDGTPGRIALRRVDDTWEEVCIPA